VSEEVGGWVGGGKTRRLREEMEMEEVTVTVIETNKRYLRGETTSTLPSRENYKQLNIQQKTLQVSVLYSRNKSTGTVRKNKYDK